MTTAGFKLVSGIFGGQTGAHNKQKRRGPQLGIFNHGRQNKAARRNPQQDLKAGWFYWKFGRPNGPFNDAEVLDLLDKGELSEDSLVSLMNVPLAMLLRDPAERLDFQTKVHLKKPDIENVAVSNQDAENHVLAASAVANAEPEKDDDSAFRATSEIDRVGKGNQTKKTPAFQIDLGDVDVSRSPDDTMKPGSEARRWMTRLKVKPTWSVKATGCEAANGPSQTARRAAGHTETQKAKPRLFISRPKGRPKHSNEVSPTCDLQRKKVNFAHSP